MSFDRREFIKGACAALGLTTSAVKLAETIATEDDSWLREAMGLEWFEERKVYGRDLMITARSQGVTAPPVVIHDAGTNVDWDTLQLAKRMIVQWFREGGVERTLSRARARE